MQIHNLKREHKNKKMHQVGRGGKRGKTSGRGTKGQKARAGHKIRPEIRDIIMKIPKLRGYAFKSLGTKPVIVNIQTLEAVFSNGETISPKSLLEKKVISARSGKMPEVKILGDGELTKKINVENCFISIGAKEKIEKAGGIVKSKNAVKIEKPVAVETSVKEAPKKKIAEKPAKVKETNNKPLTTNNKTKTKETKKEPAKIS